MMGWAGTNGWMWLLMATATIGFWVLVALTVRALVGSSRARTRATADAVDVLRQRLARGEISPEDFEHRRRLLIDRHAIPPIQDRPPPQPAQDRPPPRPAP
jgi:putative membrane protein